ncbi:hypothetical protein OEZ85_003989 [Tetradesmus obliquus]|uniref:DNA excision repair protein ERCC-8 n=1 Tax=Tetradesmus obliquus TaxID=3088 RepID=A0ABY8UD09_TETOB|nr:hypothetical protein OEZ85_003989 [Tetradesmus obliquus]
MAFPGWQGVHPSKSDSHEENLVQLLAQTATSGRAGRATRKYLRHRICNLSLSRHTSVDTSQVGGIRWLDLDSVEQRYLLTAAADSTLEAFDVLAAAAGSGQEQVQLSPLFTVKRGHPAAHKYQVTSINWYPVDTGLFITGSADQDVKVWDTNMLEVACVFSCSDKVMCTGMSSCGSHALIAVGTKKPGVVLADVASGAFTHTLSGHLTGTWAVCWSPSNEHQLFTGDASGEVRLWDIRRSGTRALLDMAVTQKPKPRPGVTPAAAAGAGASGRAANGHDGSNSRRSSGVKRKASAAAAAAAAEGGGGAEEDTYDDPRFGVGVRHRGRATKPMAHEGPVTCIHATADGLSLLTAGADNRLRLWDSCHLHHQLLHYSDTFNRGAFPKRMCSTPDGRYLFFPRGDDIQVFDIASVVLQSLAATKFHTPHERQVASSAPTPQLHGHITQQSNMADHQASGLSERLDHGGCCIAQRGYADAYSGDAQ